MPNTTTDNFVRQSNGAGVDDEYVFGVTALALDGLALNGDPLDPFVSFYVAEHASAHSFLESDVARELGRRLIAAADECDQARTAATS